MKVLATPHILEPWFCILQELPGIYKLKHTFMVHYVY